MKLQDEVKAEELPKVPETLSVNAGEIEIRKAFEETAVRNIQAVIAFSNETRKLVKLLEDKITFLTNDLISQKAAHEQTKKQLAHVQTKLFAGGTS